MIGSGSRALARAMGTMCHSWHRQGRVSSDLVGKQDPGDGKQQVALGGHGARLVGQKKGLIGGDQGPRPGAAAD